jgi:hypothetical protein
MCFRRVRSWITDGCRGLVRSLRGLSLLPAVCLAITGAVAIVLLATWILRELIHTSAKEADPVDTTKLSFNFAEPCRQVGEAAFDHRQRDPHY